MRTFAIQIGSDNIRVGAVETGRAPSLRENQKNNITTCTDAACHVSKPIDNKSMQ